MSNGMKPVHAGLTANDVLILLDEVHLSNPFKQTLEQLDSLRQRFSKTGGLQPRFHKSFLSATPGPQKTEPFRLTEEERNAESPLGTRLNAHKPVSVVEVSDREELESICVTSALELIKEHDTIAVIVNTVRTAFHILQGIRAATHGSQNVESIILTGRMRPLDRDDAMVAIRPRIEAERARLPASAQNSKLIIVATQCIEAGADFDFDAIVSESASLDSLRQRFGRLDRLGQYGKAEGVIVHDKSLKVDPIYGESRRATVKWIKETIKKKTIDFGILHFPSPTDDLLQDLQAPRPKAPVLMPAYLDLWAQTAPAPRSVPDVSLWLHGPKTRPEDVRVVWRADVTEDVLDKAATSEDLLEQLLEAATAIHPSSLEAASVPFVTAIKWLQGSTNKGVDIFDVEGGISEDYSEEDTGPGRRAILWDGERSRVVSSRKEEGSILPGCTLIVPSTYGGMQDNCFNPEPQVIEPVADLAERAAFQGRGQVQLRLHPDVLKALNLPSAASNIETPVAEVQELLHDAQQPEKQIIWRSAWLKLLTISSVKTFRVGTEESGWRCLQGRKLSPGQLSDLFTPEDTAEAGTDMTTDEDDSFHGTRQVSLAQHSNDVEHFAREYAQAAGLPPDLVSDIALAGWLHDIGKADRRFQIMLHGDEIAYLRNPTPLAKSGTPKGAQARHTQARLDSRYPKGTRHEVQSVAMITLERNWHIIQERAHDIDLVLHLVVSHHGHCRPFAPVPGADPGIEVELPGHSTPAFGAVDFVTTTSRNNLHSFSSPIADRFWNVVKRYGWLETCWLEAILRLADHRASEMEQEKDNDT